MDKYIGRLLDGRYEILEEIGRGGMAVVYRARCHRLNRYVAVKILKEDLSRDDDFRRRFHAESQAVAMLSHPNIMAVYDVNHSTDADYIVMELIDGLTLKQYMQQRGTISWREALHFATQIAKALEHAHSRGIVHRDIKPHNIMILKDGSVKVADFGIARLSSSQSTLTREALGSVHYISPEQAKGAQVDSRSDLYSLGVVMYEMLAGKPPYDGESPVAIAIQHINSVPLPPRQLNSTVPLGLQQITLHAMCSELSARYSSATAMIEDLEALRKNPQIVFRFNAGPGGATAYVDPRTVTKAPTAPQTNPAATSAAAGAGAAAQQRTAAQSQNVQRQPQTQNQTQTQDSQAAAKQKARNMAEMSVQRANEQKRAAKKQPSYIEPDYYDDEDERGGSKVPIIIVSVLLVLVVAIGILMWKTVFAPSDTELVTVPSFLGMPIEDVLYDPDYVDLNLMEGEHVYSDEYEEGEVCGQSIEKDKQVAPGTTIRLNVSKGVQTAQMPDLVNKTSQEIDSSMRELIASLDISIEYSYVESDTVAEGHVISTDPEAGTMLSVGDTVTITISTGEGTKMTMVPDVIDLEEADAIDQLEDAGLKYAVTYEEDDTEEGLVFYQSYKHKTEVPVGTTVNIKVSLGEPEPSPSPSPSKEPEPSEEPTPTPTPTPSPSPSIEPSPSPSTEPSPSPTVEVTPSPSVEPEPSVEPAAPSEPVAENPPEA